MNKKLPGVYANKIEKKLNNNSDIFYSANNSERNNDVKETENLNIIQKIDNIFSSTKFVYKAEVSIKLRDKTVKKTVIGQNTTHLITIENELIPIVDIIDIDFTN